MNGLRGWKLDIYKLWRKCSKTSVRSTETATAVEMMLADWLCQNIRKCLPLVSTTFSNRQVYPVSIKQYTFSSKDSVKQYLIVCLVALDVAEDRANLLISSSWGHTLVLRAERDGSSSMLASTAGGQWVSSRKLWLRLPSSFENRSSTLSSITQWNRMRVGKVIWFFFVEERVIHLVSFVVFLGRTDG